MTVRNLDALLHPRSVAVIGAAADPILRNIRAGGFEGPVWPVDPDRPAAIADLPDAPDVAIIALPPEALPGAIAGLGARGCRLAVVTGRDPGPGRLRQAMLDAARPHLLRIVGPGSFGVVVPGARLNASLAHGPASPDASGCSRSPARSPRQPSTGPPPAASASAASSRSARWPTPMPATSSTCSPWTAPPGRSCSSSSRSRPRASSSRPPAPPPA